MNTYLKKILIIITVFFIFLKEELIKETSKLKKLILIICSFFIFPGSFFFVVLIDIFYNYSCRKIKRESI